MNLDALGGKWFNSAYHLHSLSKLVHDACNIYGFSQMVQAPTRIQYNDVSGTTSTSCIDHVYTNNQFRCSKVSVIPFGNSDHDLISYVRYSKEPPAPARTIRRRSYKNFVAEDFIADLTNSNWYLVYSSQDVDTAVERFTALFNEALDHHAALITYQQ